VKFLARARRKGFREILLGKETISKDNEKLNLNKLDEKAKSKSREKNELAFEELVLSIDTTGGDSHIAFQAICCCKNDDCKNGNAADAWAWLTAKYVLNITSIKLELKSEFQQSKLWDATQDPDVWISDLELLWARLKEVKLDILDEDFIVQFLMGYLRSMRFKLANLKNALEAPVTRWRYKTCAMS